MNVTPNPGRQHRRTRPPLAHYGRGIEVTHSQLREVVAIGRSIDLPQGGRLIVAALEIWSDGLVLHTAEQPRGQRGFTRRAPRQPTWTGTDDLGTTYRSGLVSGGKWLGGRVRRIYAITPTPPLGVALLTLWRSDLGAEATIEVSLPR